LKLLVLGGSVFLGRHVVETALARGHAVTLFNRGKTAPDLFPEVERIRGDRNGDLDGLRGRQWDAVIDTSGMLHLAVRASAELLADSVSHFTFISSVSAYAGLTRRRSSDEESPLARLPRGAARSAAREHYGAQKAACERAVREALLGRALVVRPGLIVGPHDPSDRFTYWPERVARGGRVLAPGSPANPVQVVDARDLAAWLVSCAEARTVGTFNATGPARPLTMRGLLTACRDALAAEARFTWVSDEFLRRRRVRPFLDLPLWMLERDAGFFRVSSAKARAQDLVYRPLAETVRDTQAWSATRPDPARKLGLAPEREAELLRAWRNVR